MLNFHFICIIEKIFVKEYFLMELLYEKFDNSSNKTKIKNFILIINN